MNFNQSRHYQVCINCVMDNSDKNIVFDVNSECERSNEYEKRILPRWNKGKGIETELILIFDKVINGKG